jgi:adenylyltransferase/sulfurtransferase
MFKEEDIERYSRQLILDEIGPSGQDAICRSSVLVIGAGGLSCPVLSYLTGAGIGRLSIVDFDNVSLSNLHRQFLYTTDDIGKNKAVRAVERLSKLNPTINLTAYPEKFEKASGNTLIKSHDLIIDCSDSIELRYQVDELCRKHNKPLVFGAIQGNQGQFALLNTTNGPSYETYFPKNSGILSVEDCNDSGVLGPLCGIIGSFQSILALRHLIGKSQEVAGKLFILDGKRNELYNVKTKSKQTEIKTEKMKTIDPISFYNLDKSYHTIIDVREVGEEPVVEDYKRILIPLGEIPSRLHEIPMDKEVYMICRSGRRSENAIHFLETQGYMNLINVEGGTLGFIEQKENNV